MRHPSTRLTPFALALLALACRASRPLEVGPEPADAGSALSSTPDDGPGGAFVLDAGPPSSAGDGGDDDSGSGAGAEPAAYLAYVAEVDRRCKPKEEQLSTWGMVNDVTEYLGCHAGILTANVARLAPAKRAALLDADPASPRGARPDPVGALRTRTVDALCGFDKARLWYLGGMEQAGTECHISSRLCFQGPDLGAGFLVQAWLAGKARDAADHVRAHVASGRQVRGVLPAWKRYAPLAGSTAPFAASAGRDCSMFRLEDASWRALERDLALVESGPPQLATALCGAWPELAGALGGPAACAAALTAYHLSFAAKGDSASGWDPGPIAAPDPADTDLPPPGDADLEATLLPVRDRCAEAPSSSRCLADARRAEETAAHLPAARRLEAWAGDVCSLPGVFLTLRVNSAAYHASFSRIAPDAGCAATADLLQLFALRRLGAGGAVAFAAHVRGRASFGQAMKADVGEARSLVSAPCADGKDCTAGTPAERAKVSELLRGILANARPLAAELCTTDGLAAALGGGDPCAEAVERWLFSFGSARLDRR